MAEGPEGAVLICVRVADMARPGAAVDRERCGQCGRPVWVEQGVPHDSVLCRQCFRSGFARGQYGLPAGLHPLARARLAGAGYAEALLDRFEEEVAAELTGPPGEVS